MSHREGGGMEEHTLKLTRMAAELAFRPGTPAQLLEFSRAVQESLRGQLDDALVEQALDVLTTQQKQLNPSPAPPRGRLERHLERGLIKLLAEVVMADGVAYGHEDQAVHAYVLDHLAVSEMDADRLMSLYAEAKFDPAWQGAEADLSQLSPDDRETIFEACCKVAWADASLDQREQEHLAKIAEQLGLPAGYAARRTAAYGAAARPAPLEAASAPGDWLQRTLQLLAIDHLAQKKSASISPDDSGWTRHLSQVSPEDARRALANCPVLQPGPQGYTWKAGADAQTWRIEAALLRILLGQGSPLSARFVSPRIQPPRPYPETNLLQLAETSPALVRYSLGNGRWLGARLWGSQGALHLVREDWALLQKDILAGAGYPPLEWHAIADHARGLGAQNIVRLAEAHL